MYHADVVYFADRDTNSLPAAEMVRYKKFKEIEAIFLAEKASAQRQMEGITTLSNYMAAVKQEKGSFTKSTNKSYKPKNEIEKKIKSRMKVILMAYKPEFLEKEIGTMVANSQQNSDKVVNDSLRIALVGDNPSDMTEKYYGCNRYKGPDAMHGTHVSVSLLQKEAMVLE